MTHLKMPVAALVAVFLTTAASATTSPQADAWEIGPVIRSKNYSVGVPLHPTPERRGWYFDFPFPEVGAGHVHYVTYNHGPLSGKRVMTMRYRVDVAPGVRIVPRQAPHLPPTISLYLQRRGDTWSGKGRYETYRWYGPIEHVPLTPGVHELSVRLDKDWKAVGASTVATEPYAFGEALSEADRVGFVLGAYGGRGHGVYATGPARFTMISFEVR